MSGVIKMEAPVPEKLSVVPEPAPVSQPVRQQGAISGMLQMALDNPKLVDTLWELGIDYARKEMGINQRKESSKKPKLVVILNAIKEFWWFILLMVLLYWMTMLIQLYLELKIKGGT